MIEGHDYTIYSHGPIGRSRMYAFLALITAFLTPLAQHWALVIVRQSWGDDWDLAKAALFFGGFTALILYGVLVNVFDNYLWSMRIGSWMFSLIGLSAPPDLNGEYCGTLEMDPTGGERPLIRTDFIMKISQSWQQISLLVQREALAGGLVLVHSDMASVRIGMSAGVTILRFVYTFEESMPRRDGIGSVAQKFTGAGAFEFRREGDVWQVRGHFFDDNGRSGRVNLRQVLLDVETATQTPPTATEGKSPSN